MHLFETSQGFVFAFGFNMNERKPDIHMVSWCDPEAKEWLPATTNQAGWQVFQFPINPEFVRELPAGIVAYQPGRCLEFSYTGHPFIWSVTVLQPK